MVSVLHNFGGHELQEHNVEVAQNLLERALAGARQFPGASHTLMILDSLGTAALLAGDAHRAASLYREAIVEAHGIGHARGVTILAGLAAAEAQDADPSRAALLWGAAQQALERYGPVYDPSELELFSRSTRNLDPALIKQGGALDEQEALELALAGTQIEPQHSVADGPKVAS
jgi:hypothetical protein